MILHNRLQYSVSSPEVLVSAASVACAALRAHRPHKLHETKHAQQERAVILLVEDEPALRQLMQTSLELDGFNVITAANGLDGLHRYGENRDRIEVVVTDLDMPEMNGSEMLRHIYALTPRIKVIVASGRKLQAEQDPAGWAPPFCLHKPYTARELRAAVRLLL